VGDCGRLCFVGLASALVGLVCLYPNKVQSPLPCGIHAFSHGLICKKGFECMYTTSISWHSSCFQRQYESMDQNMLQLHCQPAGTSSRELMEDVAALPSIHIKSFGEFEQRTLLTFTPYCR